MDTRTRSRVSVESEEDVVPFVPLGPRTQLSLEACEK